MAGDLILVVEDNTLLLEGIRDLLEVSGYRVLMAGDAVQALALLEHNHPDLIVSDIMMPGMDGYELYEQVRLRPDLLDTPFVFVTARGEKADIRRGKELGADDYITKPFEEEDLLVVVRAKLARRQALKQQGEDQFSELKRTIVATLSHEFRTPLTYVINYSEMLGSQGGQIDPDDFRQFMQGIRRGAERLHRLVLDFITLVELETGEAESTYQFRRRVIDDISPWLRTVVRRHQEAAEARHLRLEIDVPDGLPPVLADEVYLANAIGRLLENAVKFSKPTSERIRVWAEADGTSLRLSVEDQGVGIRQEELVSLFVLFRQIDRPKQEQQGTGSGLAICRGIVEIHGGKVEVASVYELGSTFTIQLPLAGANPPPPSLPPA
ncbi:MAG: response regulator [Anaerolineales bacterium]|nr:response regulator [Anaerolineales bacterium]